MRNYQHYQSRCVRKMDLDYSINLSEFSLKKDSYLNLAAKYCAALFNPASATSAIYYKYIACVIAIKGFKEIWPLLLQTKAAELYRKLLKNLSRTSFEPELLEDFDCFHLADCVLNAFDHPEKISYENATLAVEIVHRVAPFIRSPFFKGVYA